MHMGAQRPPPQETLMNREQGCSQSTLTFTRNGQREQLGSGTELRAGALTLGPLPHEDPCAHGRACVSRVLFKDRSLESSVCPHGTGELTHYDSVTLNAASDCSQQCPQKGPSPTCGSEALGQPARTPQTQARPRKPQSGYPCSRRRALLGQDQPRDPSSTRHTHNATAAS